MGVWRKVACAKSANWIVGRDAIGQMPRLKLDKLASYNLTGVRELTRRHGRHDLIIDCMYVILL